nr:hypothetical protein [Tanacetum cinerariifolium]
MRALINHNLCLRVQLLIPKTQGETFSPLIRDCLLRFLMKDELAQESDKEEVFASREDIDGDTQADEEEYQSPPSNTDKPESSHTQDTTKSAFDSSSPELKKYDNILPLTETQLVKYLGKVSKVLFNRITEEQWA